MTTIGLVFTRQMAKAVLLYVLWITFSTSMMTCSVQFCALAIVNNVSVKVHCVQRCIVYVRCSIVNMVGVRKLRLVETEEQGLTGEIMTPNIA